MQQSENIRGAIYMCLSMVGFVFNDAVIKYASTDIGIYQSIFVRWDPLESTCRHASLSIL